MVDAAAERVNVRYTAAWSAAISRGVQRRCGKAPFGEMLFLRRVVALAGQHLQIVIGHVHLDFAELAVMRGVGRIVAESVLAAQFLGNLVEGFGEMLLGRSEEH